MGKLLPGIFIAFENPKGGVGKSTLTAIFAGYIHATSKDTNLSIVVADIDDAQNTIGKIRQYESQNSEISEEYQVLNISSSDIINQIDFLKENFDLIIIDFPGNLKQPGVVECLMIIDIIIIPFTPNKIEIRHSIDFYNYYVENILLKREQLGYKTTLRALPNRVLANLLEYKEMLASQQEFPFKLLENHIKESRVNYQRNLSTIIKDYNHCCDEFGEEMIQLITEHIKQD